MSTNQGPFERIGVRPELVNEKGVLVRKADSHYRDVAVAAGVDQGPVVLWRSTTTGEVYEGTRPRRKVDPYLWGIALASVSDDVRGRRPVDTWPATVRP